MMGDIVDKGLQIGINSSGLRGGKKQADPLGMVFKDKAVPAAAAEPTVMPEADDEAVKAAQRRRAAAMKRRGGRESTILGGEDTLGGSR